MRMLPSAVMKGIEKKTRLHGIIFFRRISHQVLSRERKRSQGDIKTSSQGEFLQTDGKKERKKKATRTGYGHPQDGNEKRTIEILLPITGRQRGNLKKINKRKLAYR
jgi:hypothetical protein